MQRLVLYRNLNERQARVFEAQTWDGLTTSIRQWMDRNKDACDGLAYGDLSTLEDLFPAVIIITHQPSDEAPDCWEVEQPDMEPTPEDWPEARDMFVDLVVEAHIRGGF